MEPEPQHVEVRRVGVYRYVNELAGKLVERTPIGWNRIIAAIGVEQIGLELQHRIKFCRPESAAPRNMCPFHLFLPARQLRRQRGTAILQFVGENWKAGYAAVDPENAGEFEHFDDLVRTGAVEKCCLHMMLQRLAVEIGACSVRSEEHTSEL